MSLDITVNTCLLDVEQLRDPSALEPFLDSLANLGEGFFLSDFPAEHAFGDWYDAVISLDSADAAAMPEERRREVTSPGSSAMLRESVGRFKRREQEDLIINAFSIDRNGPYRGMHYLLSVLNHEEAVHDDGTEYVRVATLRIGAGEDAINGPDNEALLHSMPRHLYEAWHPLMTYLTYGDVPDTRTEDAAAGRISHLYAINVYSPQVVEHFGRERLLATPGAIVESLGDGGMQVEPWNMHEAAAYLGLRWTVM